MILFSFIILNKVTLEYKSVFIDMITHLEGIFPYVGDPL